MQIETKNKCNDPIVFRFCSHGYYFPCSSFAHLSTAITVNDHGRASDPADLRKYFPHFMWLLRDVIREEEDPPLIEYLNAEALKPTGQKDYDSIVTAIRTLFPPPLLCVSLPTPNLELGKTLQEEDNIGEYFKKESEKLINGEGGIKASVRPKVGFGEGIKVTGEVLAELAETYINALNEKGSVPSLEGAWGAVIELKLAEEVEKSVGLYMEEMTAKVEGSLPMEHSIPEEDSDKPTLIGCHWVVFGAKREKLSEKMRQIIPQPGPDDPPVEQGDLYKSMMKRFKDAIVEEGEGGMDTMEGVKSGKLLQFTTDNYRESDKQCEELWDKLLKEHEVMTKSAKALNKYNAEVAVELCSSMERLKGDYGDGAKGPARDKVYARRNERLEQIKESMQAIPGPPKKLKVVGKATDRIKLQWKEPAIHPQAAKKYIVKYRLENKKWEKVETKSERWCIVRNLKTNTGYEFEVASWNDEAHEAKQEIQSLVKEGGLKSGTRLGRLARIALSAIGFVNGTMMAPVLSTGGMAAKAKESESTAKALGLLATIPFLATLGAPIVGGRVAYHVVKETGDWGDLEERYVEDSDASSANSTTEQVTV